jgi:hypothetical protein
MSAFLLNRIEDCYVAGMLSGFPPNSTVNLSMIAFEDGNFAGFPSGNYFFEDFPIGADGTAQYALGPVWLDREFGVVVTVQPFATSPIIGEVWTIDLVELPESCNPND